MRRSPNHPVAMKAMLFLPKRFEEKSDGKMRDESISQIKVGFDGTAIGTSGQIESLGMTR